MNDLSFPSQALKEDLTATLSAYEGFADAVRCVHSFGCRKITACKKEEGICTESFYRILSTSLCQHLLFMFPFVFGLHTKSPASAPSCFVLRPSRSFNSLLFLFLPLAVPSVNQVRRDLQQLSQSGVPITNKRAARHMKKWGCEKFYAILSRTLHSLLGASLERWRLWLRQLRAAERREAYRKYQAV